MIKIEALFDESGKWIGSSDRMIRFNNQSISIDEYAEQHGIQLPEPKISKKSVKQVNIDIEEKEHADMGQQDDSGDTE